MYKTDSDKNKLHICVIIVTNLQHELTIFNNLKQFRQTEIESIHRSVVCTNILFKSMSKSQFDGRTWFTGVIDSCFDQSWPAFLHRLRLRAEKCTA